MVQLTQPLATGNSKRLALTTFMSMTITVIQSLHQATAVSVLTGPVAAHKASFVSTWSLIDHSGGIYMYIYVFNACIFTVERLSTYLILM